MVIWNLNSAPRPALARRVPSFASCLVLAMLAGCAPPRVAPSQPSAQPVAAETEPALVEAADPGQGGEDDQPAPTETTAAPSMDAEAEAPAADPATPPVAPPAASKDSVAAAPLADPDPVAEGPPAVKVGLLLPLSGPAAALGHAMQNAAQLALFDTFAERLVLVAKDTGGTPDGAERAMRSAVDDGVAVVLGPLFNSSVRAVAPVARSHDLRMVAFSNDRSVAGKGVYLLGFTPAQQVARIVAYASDHGHRRIAALIPEDDYGNAVVTALFDAVQSTGGQVDRIEFLPPDDADVTEVVRRLARAGDSGPERSFDAVLIAAGGQRLRAIAPLFPYFDLDTSGVRLLGTELWHRSEILGEPAIVNGWFAAPPPGQWEQFQDRYRSQFGAPPPRRAVLAYDAVALAGALTRVPGADQADPGGAFDDAQLTTPGGFIGTEGVFRFRADGIAERGLAVYRVTTGGFEVIDPAKTDFGAGAF
ncbi:MAG: penicillin-binding protein activator [Alphaproteobacteria bacterium]|nr:penicillin-binding protein activator [Alphaproteobacteria bacterium]MDP6516057.1 penicillin-binding protein activator [Alphaproteobacteria bacterium]